jgi:hypothetical protein
MVRWVLLFACVLGAAAALACSESPAPKVDEPTLGELLAAPTDLTLGAQHLVLESHLFLDRMPQIPPSFHGFSGEARVWDTALDTIPDGVDVSRIWIILGVDVWEGHSLPVIQPEAIYELRRRVQSDRAWGNVTVQVVVEVSAGHDLYLLRAPDQRIQVVL